MEIEKDLALVMRPRSKAERLVLTNILLEAGLTLITKAESHATLPLLSKARAVRNGLMIAMLALHPIRLKNFSDLETGRNFRSNDGTSWIVLPASETREKRPDERRIDALLEPVLTRYLEVHRIILQHGRDGSTALWLSSSGAAMTYAGVAAVISHVTLSTVGIDISSQMFRTAAATSASLYDGVNLRLGSAVLNHRDQHTTEQHYRIASSHQAGNTLRSAIRKLI